MKKPVVALSLCLRSQKNNPWPDVLSSMQRHNPLSVSQPNGWFVIPFRYPAMSMSSIGNARVKKKRSMFMCPSKCHSEFLVVFPNWRRPCSFRAI
jgi:hypothetical protein